MHYFWKKALKQQPFIQLLDIECQSQQEGKWKAKALVFLFQG